MPPDGLKGKADFGDHTLGIYVHDGAPGTPESHDAKDDIFLIQSGSSDFRVGGTGVSMRSTGSGEKLGTDISGATTIHLVKGDVITIPAGMVHQYLTKPGEKITYLVIRRVKQEDTVPPQPQMEGMPVGVIHWPNGTPPEGLQHKANFGDHILYGYHREKSGAIEFHETQDDVFVVEKGEADFLVGGTGVGMRVSGKGEQQGTSIDGATRVHLTNGDVITIPANMPHQFVLTSGQQLDYFIIKIVKSQPQNP
ncbi:cupin domain-containing protein [Terriglobus roseus]|nr:cupin domain-containing protein [Terriglobus roseus]